MSNAAEIVACARGWIGTRFAHQGRRKAVGADKGGVDCLGLLVGVATECSLRLGDLPLAHLDRCDYSHFPDERQLYEGLRQCLVVVPTGQMAPADVLLLRVDGRAQHVGLVAPYAGGGLSLIHAYAPARCVVEHRLDEAWQSNIAAVLRWPCGLVADCHESDTQA